MLAAPVFVAAAIAAGLAGSAGAAGLSPEALLAPPDACGPDASRLDLGLQTAVQTMRCLTNYARERAGLRPLAPSPVLDRAGQDKLAQDVSCGVFSHTPCGKPFARVFASYLEGARRYTIGENIAWGSGSLGTPRATMNAWLHSPEHRENILDADYRELGIGYRAGLRFQGYDGVSLWSQEFGSR